MVKDLIALERDAISAYQLAIDNIVDEPMTRDTLSSFRSEQLARVQQLEAILRGLGSAPTTIAPRSQLLCKDPESFAAADSTTKVLQLLKDNGELVVHAYQGVLHADLPEAIADLVRAACNDQLRHRAWIAARVDAFSAVRRASSRPRPLLRTG